MQFENDIKLTTASSNIPIYSDLSLEGHSTFKNRLNQLKFLEIVKRITPNIKSRWRRYTENPENYEYE